MEYAHSLVLGLVKDDLVQKGPLANRIAGELSIQRKQALGVINSLTYRGYLRQSLDVSARGNRVKVLQLTEKGLGLFKPYC